MHQLNPRFKLSYVLALNFHLIPFYSFQFFARFLILSAKSLKYMWLICSSPWLITPISGCLITLYPLFILLDFFGIWSCLLVCHMIFHRVPDTECKNYGGNLRLWIVLFPSREDLFCFWEALRVGKNHLNPVHDGVNGKLGLWKVRSIPHSPLPLRYNSSEPQLKVWNVYLSTWASYPSHSLNLILFPKTCKIIEVWFSFSASSLQPKNWKLPQRKKWHWF